ncbi:uncharacterized protein LOC105428934 [Pogonomyrmex barbatus]|uniref:Uncharacterized protein LOC105428934 n=1 Tax=Pogonomyrmex barbatus TaxID=144034 RepID=A0A6I9WK94_9HYME|nr:uncharacterized protein LOC105428934 [Pogonomyrmex barbatus]
MKMLAKIILSGYFAIVTFNNFSIGVKVSSNVDLDSNEETIALDNTTFDTIVNLKKSANPPESILHASKSTFWHGSELIRASEPRKRKIYPSHDDSAKQPKIINNIQVVVNNDSIPNENSCEHGICNVTVSSKQDEKGNIVTEVHLSIITRAKLNKIDDVPVITGFRGVNEDHAKQPIFHSINSPRLMHTHLHRDNIPQVRIVIYWNSHLMFCCIRIISINN